MAKITRFKDNENSTKKDFDYLEKLNDYIKSGLGTNVEKFQNFSKYVPRQDLTNFIAKYELFKKILHVPGSIVECGVLFGGGLMSFAQLSAILEPINFERKIIGFDTFAGLANISKFDKSKTSKTVKNGMYAINSYNDLMKSIKLFDSNRFLNHFSKVELVKGDVVQSIPKYLSDNPSTLISLLYLDVLIYKPTKVALENFVPRMPKGSIIAFNTLNDKQFPGTTKAVLDTIGIKDKEMHRFDFTPYTQFIIL